MLERDFGGRLQVRRGAAIDVLALPGFVAEEGGRPVGLLTYRRAGAECELAFLAAVERRRGVGTALLRALVEEVGGGARIWVVTTNDNLDALRFYQRRGFTLCAVRPGAVDEARRRLKPQLSAVGDFGIPLRDELELELVLPGAAGRSLEVPPVARRPAEPDTTAPDGSEIRLLLDQAAGATRASLCEVTLPAGQVSRPVWHRHVEELWYVLQGRGEVWRCPPAADPARVPAVAVAPGDALVIPTGYRFQFRASPDGPLRFLCFTAPPWPGPDEAQPAAAGGLGPATV
jgi:mannose-6-phosphate isomerase-like protein (cupin superfamily)